MSNGYEKLATELFGEFAFKGIKDKKEFENAVNAALETIEPEQKAAVIAVCFEGKEPDEVYAKARRNLMHPSRSKELSQFLVLEY